MHHRLQFSLAFAIAASLLALPAGGEEDAWQFDEPVLVLDDLSVPVDFAFGRDGYLYIALLTERAIVRADMDSGDIDARFRVELPDADWQIYTETGLFSIALDPEFHRNGVMYASYSRNESGEWQNVLSRITLEDATGSMHEEVLLTRPGGNWHNGGRVMVADESLWWTTGDTIPYYEWTELARVAQEEGNMQGKVLRLTMDGDPAPDNPWEDHAYTKGHRNVFGIAWDPVNGRVLITENGNALTDYVYILEAGGNYGWPDCEGPCEEPDPDFIDPIWYSEGTIAPTGATWFRGAFWWGTFNKGELYRASDQDGEWDVRVVHKYNGAGRYDMLAVETAPDEGGIWFSTYDQVWRVPFTDHPDHPPVAALAAGPYWWEGTQRSEDAEGPATEPAPAAPMLAVLLVLLGFVLRRRRA